MDKKKLQEMREDWEKTGDLPPHLQVVPGMSNWGKKSEWMSKISSTGNDMIATDQEAAEELVRVAKMLSAKKEKRIEVIKRIVKNHTAEKIDGILVDAQTANMLIKIFEAVSKRLHSKLESLPLRKVVDFGWSMVK